MAPLDSRKGGAEVKAIHWLIRGNRPITLAAVFVVAVLAALIVSPIITGRMVVGVHEHIRRVVDPLDDSDGQIADLLARTEAAGLRYVITGEQSYLTAYQDHCRQLRAAISTARGQAARLDPDAVRLVDEIDQTIGAWEDFDTSVIALRQQGQDVDARAAVATGTGAHLIDQFWQQETSLHDYVARVRQSDDDRIDRALTAQSIASVVLGALGILAAVAAAFLARRTARLYEEVQTERSRVAELAKTEQRRAEELDAIIEDMAEGVMVADETGHVVRLNRIARQLWQLPWPEGEYGSVNGLNQLDLRYLNDKPVPLEDRPISRALRGETFFGIEFVFVSPAGRRYYLRFGGSAVRDEAGKPILGVTVFDDITQIRELEQQREEFISVVAHDLRGPITIVNGYAGLLSRLPLDQHGTDREHRAIDGIATSTKRLERMVGDLLDASRIEAKRLALAKEAVDLARFVRALSERAREITEGHEVRLETRGPAPMVEADSTRLDQILSNLLSNAAKYSYPGSEIVVEIMPRPDEVEVAVTNQGPGIPPEDRARLFARFYRTQAAAEGPVPGLGLGLYITKGLVEAHGGRIWVESEPGRFASFHFTLPTRH